MPTSVLERTPVVQETAKLSPEALAHKNRIKENYSKLFASETSDAAVAASVASITASVAAPVEEPIKFPVAEPKKAPAAAAPARTEQAYAPAKAQTLFADYDYVDHKLVRMSPQAVAVAEPETEEESEDALPTRRTMETLNHAAVQVPQIAPVQAARTSEKTSFWNALSSKTKLALAIVAVVVVAVLAIVCINTGIINSMNAAIAAKQARLGELTAHSQELLGQIESVTDPAYVDEYAEYVLGMTHP